jgi:hypothetical protein
VVDLFGNIKIKKMTIVLTIISVLTLQYLYKRVKLTNPLIKLIDKRIEYKLKQIITDEKH